MRRFEIIDGSKRRSAPCATLEWDQKRNTGTISIAPHAAPEALPFSLALIAEHGSRTLDADQTRRWIEERVVPASRQNLGQVLNAHGLDHYDPLELLIAHEGRCAQDDYYIKEVGESSASDEASLQAGRLFRTMRKQAGYTQQELAKRAGVQQSLISRLENDELNPTLNLLSDIAKALGRTLTLEAQID